MSTRTLLVSISLVCAACGGAPSQQAAPPALPSPAGLPASKPTAHPPVGTASAPGIPAARDWRAPLPPDPSIDQLLDELERVRAEKAALEKKARELKAAVQKKLEAQAERLKKLGVNGTPAEPDRVGRIVIEGNDKTPQQDILRALDLKPGAILAYPEVEAARARLLRDRRFHDVTVDVVASDLDEMHKDIKIRVLERVGDR